MMMVPATWTDIEVASGPADGDAATTPSLGPITKLFDWPKRMPSRIAVGWRCT